MSYFHIYCSKQLRRRKYTNESPLLPPPIYPPNFLIFFLRLHQGRNGIHNSSYLAGKVTGRPAESPSRQGELTTEESASCCCSVWHVVYVLPHLSVLPACVSDESIVSVTSPKNKNSLLLLFPYYGDNFYFIIYNNLYVIIIRCFKNF